MNTWLIMLFITSFIIACEIKSPPVEDAKFFGVEKFNSKIWKTSNQQTQSAMIYSFLKNHEIKKMSRKQVIELLGDPTAYYDYDEFPAYNLVSNEKKYIIAFITDNETGKIKYYVLKPQ